MRLDPRRRCRGLDSCAPNAPRSVGGTRAGVVSASYRHLDHSFQPIHIVEPLSCDQSPPKDISPAIARTAYRPFPKTAEPVYDKTVHGHWRSFQVVRRSCPTAPRLASSLAWPFYRYLKGMDTDGPHSTTLPSTVDIECVCRCRVVCT